MGFFKDLKQDANKTNEETSEAVSTNQLEDEQIEELQSEVKDTEDFIDEDMYKDILAAAEQLLTEEEEADSFEEPKQEDLESNAEELNNEKREKVENTMVDYDENAVDSEILETLLKDEEKTEEKKETVEVVEEKAHATNPELTAEDKEAVTVITKGTTINGSIISDCSLDVMGTINGDIECLGKLSITGKVIGNSMASEVYVNSNRLEGSINSEGSVKIGVGTVVIGDITATSGVIAGAVKGEVDVSGPVVIDSTAIIKGNVKAKSVQMNNGAVLEGFCSLSYSDIDINNIFE